jgi:hypothetical protein
VTQSFFCTHAFLSLNGIFGKGFGAHGTSLSTTTMTALLQILNLNLQVLELSKVMGHM